MFELEILSGKPAQHLEKQNKHKTKAAGYFEKDYKCHPQQAADALDSVALRPPLKEKYARTVCRHPQLG